MSFKGHVGGICCVRKAEQGESCGQQNEFLHNRPTIRRPLERQMVTTRAETACVIYATVRNNPPALLAAVSAAGEPAALLARAGNPKQRLHLV